MFDIIKHLVSVILSLITLISSLLSSSPQTPHEHHYNIITLEPSCTSKGIKTYTCNCGYSYSENYANQLEHDYSIIEKKESTYTSEGYIKYICKCGANYFEPIKKRPIDLTSIAPIDIFTEMSTNAKIVVNTILDCVEKRYVSREPFDVYLGDFLLTEYEKSEAETYLSLYFGSYYDLFYTTVFYPINDTHYEIYLVINSQSTLSLLTLETNRRKMMNNIIDIISSFEYGSEEFLVEQTFNYLVNSLSYKSSQADASVALKNGKGNCNAYSNLFMLILAQLGIKSDICIGYATTGGYHAWNRVLFANGQYKYYDLTFYEATNSNKYFCSSSLNHTLIQVNCYLTKEQFNLLK